MARILTAIVAALTGTFVIVVISLGYMEHGAYVPLATYQRIDPYRTEVVAVTPEGARAGLRAGDVVDAREMTTEQRIARYWEYWKAGTVFPTTVHRGNRTLIVRQPIVESNLGLALVLDVVERAILIVVGTLLIARGAGPAGLFGGVALAFLGIQQGYMISFGSVSLPVGAAAFFLQSASFPIAIAARYWFAMALLPANYPKRSKAVLDGIFVALLVILTLALVERRIEAFTGFTLANTALIWQGSQILNNVYSAVVFGIVAAYATRQNAPTMRILFWSYLFGITGLIVNAAVYGATGKLPWGGALNVTLLFFALGFTYAVFARQLVSVNFYVSKAAIYTIVLAVIVAVFILLERLIESMALGKTSSLILELAVPLALGLSIRGIERFAEGIIERVLYREKLQAEEQIEALIADFPHARDVSTLANCVVSDVHRLLHAPSVTLYRESPLGYAPISHAGAKTPGTIGSDDRAFLRMRSTLLPVDPDELGSGAPGALALPLVVVGELTGALVLSARASGERYDPDEVATLSKLAHELAVTLLWAERDTLHVPALGAL